MSTTYRQLTEEKFTFAEGPVRVEAFHRKRPDGVVVTGMLCIDTAGTRLLRIHTVGGRRPNTPTEWIYYNDSATKSVL